MEIKLPTLDLFNSLDDNVVLRQQKTNFWPTISAIASDWFAARQPNYADGSEVVLGNAAEYDAVGS